MARIAAILCLFLTGCKSNQYRNVDVHISYCSLLTVSKVSFDIHLEK